METLPRELVRAIIRDQSREDLHNVRLVNRIFAAEASPFLFHTVPVWISLKSLDHFTCLSEHPILSQYVEKVVFSPLRFVEYKDEAAYQASVRDAMEYQPESLSGHALKLGRHIAAYKGYLAGQKFLSSKSLDVKILSRAFARLSQLETLDLDCWSEIAAYQLYDAFGPAKGDALVTRDCEYAFPVLIRSLAASKRRITTFKLGEPTEFNEIDDWRDESSVYRTGPNSKAASITRPALARTFGHSDKYGYGDVFSGLRKLKISELRVEVDEPIERAQVTGPIHEMIRTASRSIESITIGEIFELTLSNLPKPSLDSLLPAYSLGRLRKLDMHQCTATTGAIFHLFQKLSKTLVKLRFSYIDIIDGDWSTALMRLRDMEFIVLELFELSYCPGLDSEVECHDYILQVSDEDPISVERKRMEDADRDIMSMESM